MKVQAVQAVWSPVSQIETRRMPTLQRKEWKRESFSGAQSVMILSITRASQQKFLLAVVIPLLIVGEAEE